MKKDFFISYNEADRSWAVWIAWQLEQEGFTTVLQDWDFRPGQNFVLQMDRATKEADRTIAVLSHHYIAAQYTQPEWAYAFSQDPTGEKGTLIPVRVSECETEGLLRPIIYIDLLGLDERAAITALQLGLQTGRAKPRDNPGFPLDSAHSGTEPPRFPGPPPRARLRGRITTAIVSVVLFAGVVVGIRFLASVGVREYRETESKAESKAENVFSLSNVQALLANQFNDEVVASKSPVLVFFYDRFSPDCQLMAPTVETIAGDYSGKVKVMKAQRRQRQTYGGPTYDPLNNPPPRPERWGGTELPDESPVLVLFGHEREQNRIVGVSSKMAIARIIDDYLRQERRGTAP